MHTPNHYDQWPPQFIPPEDEFNMESQGRAWRPSWWGQFYQWMIDRGYMDRSPIPLPSNPPDRGDMMYWPPRNISPGMDKGIAGRDMLPEKVQDFKYPPIPKHNSDKKQAAAQDAYMEYKKTGAMPHFFPTMQPPIYHPGYKQFPDLDPGRKVATGYMSSPQTNSNFAPPTMPKPPMPKPPMPSQPPMERPPMQPPVKPPPSDSLQPDPSGKIVKSPAQKTIKPTLNSYIKRYDRV